MSYAQATTANRMLEVQYILEQDPNIAEVFPIYIIGKVYFQTVDGTINDSTEDEFNHFRGLSFDTITKLADYFGHTIETTYGNYVDDLPELIALDNEFPYEGLIAC